MAREKKGKDRGRVLEKIYHLSDGNMIGIISVIELENDCDFSPGGMNGILRYLEEKGLIDWRGGDVVRITAQGIDAFENPENPNQITERGSQNTHNIVNINAPFHGGLQQGGECNKQQVRLTVDPTFSKALTDLIELIRSSHFSDLEKEEMQLEASRIAQLAAKELTPEVKKLAKSKVSLLENALKVGDMATKVAPLFETLMSYFST